MTVSAHSSMWALFAARTWASTFTRAISKYPGPKEFTIGPTQGNEYGQLSVATSAQGAASHIHKHPADSCRQWRAIHYQSPRQLNYSTGISSFFPTTVPTGLFAQPMTSSPHTTLRRCTTMSGSIRTKFNVLPWVFFYHPTAAFKAPGPDHALQLTRRISRRGCAPRTALLSSSPLRTTVRRRNRRCPRRRPASTISVPTQTSFLDGLRFGDHTEDTSNFKRRSGVCGPGTPLRRVL